jgi:ABC-type phosphate/phosphonate transport system permease subunit
MISYEYKRNLHKLATFEKKAVYKPKKFFWFTLIVIVLLLIIASFLNVEQYWESLTSQNDELFPLLSGLFN